MSDEGEKTCPLCAEEMDLTDQQLKPCKCGYEICVWCWHHIMDMAEKDQTDGRCPACRTPYNKEKIVGTASKCERMVAEMSMEKKMKSQKGKSKTSEGRKQLSSVRVIQRNLVYIVGLPLNLADEDLLQRKEYFGQYGKVLKVSISRTAAGAIQHFANSTCSVYITYAKEEEAVRSIQSVHGFILEGRPLRACFGTTKYCHAWLRSVPCTNPDCLYLHEIGSQEDSFTKDEIISAYTRSRVQQITGATYDMQRRSGNFLPPPADDYCNESSSSWAKPISKSPTNISTSSARVSPPSSSSGRSVALPAAASWGTRASSSQPPAASTLCSNGPSKQKAESCSGSLAFSTAVASPIHCGDIGKKLNEESSSIEQKGKVEQVESVKQYTLAEHQRIVSDTPAAAVPPPMSTVNSHSCTASPKDEDKHINTVPNLSNSFDRPEQPCSTVVEQDRNNVTERSTYSLCSDMSAMSIHKLQGLQRCEVEQFRESLSSVTAEKAVESNKDNIVTSEHSNLTPDLPIQVGAVASSEVEEDLLSFDDQRLKDPEVVNSNRSYLNNFSQSFHLSNNSLGYSPQQAYVSVNASIDPPFMDHKLDRGSLQHTFSTPVISNGFPANAVNTSALNSCVGYSPLLQIEGNRNHVVRFEDEAAKVDQNPALDMGENSIISNILSMDFDSWDESLTSPQNLAKLLGEPDKQQRSLRVSNSWKAQNSNQSRFSFARGEECMNQASDVRPSLSDIGPGLRNHTLNHDFGNNRDIYLDKLSVGNGFSSFNFEESDNFAGNYSHPSPNKLSVSRSQISAPPGFSGHSRTPPPGFTSHERLEQTFDNGYHMFDSSLLRKHHQAPLPVNIGSIGDNEFMDPAIMAVGRLSGGLNSPCLDMRSNFPSQLSTFDNDARLQQLLMQRSFSPHQNQRFNEKGESFSQRSDAYGLPSRIPEQSLANNRSPYLQPNLTQSRSTVMSNGHWDGWNEVQNGNDRAMAELLRTDRLGYNKFYSGYDDSKFRMSNSGDLYNRTFGL